MVLALSDRFMGGHNIPGFNLRALNYCLNMKICKCIESYFQQTKINKTVKQGWCDRCVEMSECNDFYVYNLCMAYNGYFCGLVKMIELVEFVERVELVKTVGLVGWIGWLGWFGWVGVNGCKNWIGSID